MQHIYGASLIRDLAREGSSRTRSRVCGAP